MRSYTGISDEVQFTAGGGQARYRYWYFQCSRKSLHQVTVWAAATTESIGRQRCSRPAVLRVRVWALRAHLQPGVQYVPSPVCMYGAVDLSRGPGWFPNSLADVLHRPVVHSIEDSCSERNTLRVSEESYLRSLFRRQCPKRRPS